MRSVLIHDTIKVRYVTSGYIAKNYPHHLISDTEMMEGFLTDHLEEIIDDPEIIAHYTSPVFLLDENNAVLLKDDDTGIETTNLDILIDPYFMQKRFTGFYMDFYVKPMFTQFSTLDIDEMTDDEYIIFCCMWDIAEYCITLFNEYQQGVEDGTIESKIEKKFPDWVYSYMLGAVIGQKSPVEDKHDLFVLIDEDADATNYEDDFTIENAMDCYKISSRWIKRSTLAGRPVTCFGEPHVVKSLRLYRSDY